MRFHLASLPHTATTAQFSSCAYTNKVIGFAKMMMARGHEVFLYAGEQNEAPCTELIPCITDTARARAVEGGFYTSASFDSSLPHWRTFNLAAVEGIKARAQPRDFVCLIAGLSHKPVADALPHMMAVEFGVGYSGVFSSYRVFESQAWAHMHYGHAAARAGKDVDADGQWFDAVIPGYLDPAQFPYRGKHRRGNDYYLFIGRLTDRKGFGIAQEVCQRIGARLVLAGSGERKGYGEFVGSVGPEERGDLMAGATAVFVPTQYIEPFGNVAIEAMACGTPVITTDWGAFTETVIHGVTGFRCRTLAEFCSAAEEVKRLDHQAIRRHVLRNYSLDVIGARYEAYFERLSSLWTDGWYAGATPLPAQAA